MSPTQIWSKTHLTASLQAQSTKTTFCYGKPSYRKNFAQITFFRVSLRLHAFRQTAVLPTRLLRAAFFVQRWNFRPIIRIRRPKCVSRLIFSTQMCMRMDACAFPFCILQATTLSIMKAAMSAGVPCSQLRKSSCQCCRFCRVSECVLALWLPVSYFHGDHVPETHRSQWRVWSKHRCSSKWQFSNIKCQLKRVAFV